MAKMMIQLQHEALKSDSDIMNLLRKAYLVAKKLKLQEFEDWVYNEMNGYTDLDKIPDYRLLRGELIGLHRYYGWVPVVLLSDNEEITTHLASESLANLHNVYQNSENKSAILEFSATKNNYVSTCVNFNTKYALKIGTNQIYNIIERVKNNILGWSMTLEENGILGDELQFSDTEKEIANKTPVINHYTNNFYGTVSETQIQQATINSEQQKRE